MYLGVEWAQDYPATQCEGEEEHRATEQELEQLWEGYSQCPGQSLHREEGRHKGRERGRERKENMRRRKKRVGE